MITIVNLPPQPLSPAPLAPSQFKAQLRAAGVPCQLLNFNFEFAKLVGLAPYGELSVNFDAGKFGEWLFSSSAWGDGLRMSEDEFLTRYAHDLAYLRSVPEPAAWLRRLRRDVVPGFLADCVRRVLESAPRVVAFSCMFFQTSAALALGRLLKQARPDLRLVYGGASFHSEMGDELMRKTPWIDAVSTGEADDVIVPLLEALARGETPRDLHGVIAREPGGALILGPRHVPVSAAVLEVQPTPDYADFYADAERLGFMESEAFRDRVSIMFESSRGCWWGQKSNCTFCGLNGEGMTFRAKSQEHVLAELRHLAEAYPLFRLHACDNILAMEAWKSLLPSLAAEPLRSRGQPVEIYYEIKPNLRRDQIRALRDANVTYVQPGFEALSTRLLTLMEKGVTAIQNVFVLKCCLEYGIKVDWNYLMRVPGETLEDYRVQERWVPLLHHFDPPKSVTPIACERFSPYFEQKGRWTSDIRYEPWYEAIYPGTVVDLDRVAYFFEADWKDVLDPSAYADLVRLCDTWVQRWGTGTATLTEHDEPGGLIIEDCRAAEPVIFRLGEVETAVYRGVHDIATPRSVHRGLPEALRARLGEGEVRGVLFALTEAGLVIHEDDRFIGLAVAPRPAAARLDSTQIPVREVRSPGHAASRAPSRLPLIARS